MVNVLTFCAYDAIKKVTRRVASIANTRSQGPFESMPFFLIDKNPNKQ